MTDTPCTHVLIVNYRTAALAAQAVASVLAHRASLGPRAQVLVIDNQSGDGSVEALRAAALEQAWPDTVHILPQPRNGGFAYGNNQGLRWLRQQGLLGNAHVLLLNPDAQLKEGCLSAALHTLTQRAQTGIVGVPIYGSTGEREGSAHHWPSPASELLSQAKLAALQRRWPWLDVTPAAQFAPVHGVEGQPFVCHWVSGAFFLIHRDLLAELPEMDEGYFLYFEEVDYCRRAQNLGWQVVVAGAPGIVHHEGSSTGIQDIRRPRPGYWYDSRRRYLINHHGLSGLLLADLCSLVGRALFLPRKWLRLGAASRSDKLPREYHRRMLASDLQALRRGGR